MSSEHWRIVYSKNEAVDNCLLKEITTGILSSEHWNIVFSKIDAVTTNSRASTALGYKGETLVVLVKQVSLGLG